MAGLKLKNLDLITLSSGVVTAASASSLPVYNCIIQADASNTGNVFVGGDDVDTTKGLPIEPQSTMTLSIESGKFTEFDLSDVYFITNTTGNKIRITYFTRKV